MRHQNTGETIDLVNITTETVNTKIK